MTDAEDDAPPGGVTGGPPERGDHFAKTLARGLEVIRAFSADQPQPTLSEIARTTGLSRAAARRFLLTLVDLDYVGVVDRRFHLRPTVLELGYTYLSVLGVPQVATPHLVALTERLDESTSLGVLDGDDVVYVARIGSRRVFVNGATVGMRGAAWLSSHGRVLLAALPAAELDAHLERVQLERRTAHTVRDTGELRRRLAQVRAQGWSLVEEELEEGVTSLAAPVHGPDGTVVASANIASHAHRLGAGPQREAALEALQETVAAIERDLARMGGGVQRIPR